MYRKLASDLGTWSKGEISWLGRIHAVKMTLLPRLLYLFRAILININKDHLTKFQKKITKYIWGGEDIDFNKEPFSFLELRGAWGLLSFSGAIRPPG